MRNCSGDFVLHKWYVDVDSPAESRDRLNALSRPSLPDQFILN